MFIINGFSNIYLLTCFQNLKIIEMQVSSIFLIYIHFMHFEYSIPLALNLQRPMSYILYFI